RARARNDRRVTAGEARRYGAAAIGQGATKDASKMKREELALRKAIIAACRKMNDLGINQGTSGNITARSADQLLITPPRIPYEEMTPGDIARMPLEGEYGSWEGPLRPSSEWRFHLDIARARPEVGAIVHAHSTYSTVLAICGKEIPAVHYMIAA